MLREPLGFDLLVLDVLATMLLVLGFDYATFAATGDSLILGKTNKATKATKIQRTTPGPVISLKAKKKSNPPFATNAKGKVKNLNADTLDGVDSSKLGVRPIVYTKTTGSFATSQQVFSLGSIPPGKYRTALNMMIFSDMPLGVSQCDLMNTTTNVLGMFARDVPPGGNAAALTGAGYLEVGAGDVVTLTCNTNSPDPWGPGNGIPWRVTLTPVAGVCPGR